MPEIYRSQEVAISQKELYQLVADVENYPKFYYVNSVTIIERTSTNISLIDCDLRGIPIEFTTETKIFIQKVLISLVKGHLKP